MKVKYLLALALSHHAELLILDEPTSGLDPVSREELLHIFSANCENENVLFCFLHILLLIWIDVQMILPIFRMGGYCKAQIKIHFCVPLSI